MQAPSITVLSSTWKHVEELHKSGLAYWNMPSVTFHSAMLAENESMWRSFLQCLGLSVACTVL
eukprot:1142696-Pelagomonas_calceolata.AAC.2